MFIACILCSESDVKALQASSGGASLQQRSGKLSGNRESDSTFQLVCCVIMFTSLHTCIRTLTLTSSSFVCLCVFLFML